MKPVIPFSILVCSLSATTFLFGAEASSLDPHLEPLRGLLGKTWKGEFTNSTPEKPLADTMQWERALNGKAVRVLHSVNNGSYGGETLFTWDEQKQAVSYHYFTTAGFMTVGTVAFQDSKLLTHELVSGRGAGGVTEVRAVSEFLPDGKFRVKGERLKAGVWEPGRDVTYSETPSAKVVFK